MNTHKEEPEIVIETKDGHSWMCECSKCLPTPPSQIEEESQTQRSLREMYELGKEHGRTLALKDMEIERLIEETEELL